MLVRSAAKRRQGLRAPISRLPIFQTTSWSNCATRAPVAFTASRFAAPVAGERQADSLNDVLAKFDIRTMRSHFGLPARAVRSRVEVAAALPSEPEPKKFAKKGMDTDFIQSGFVQVVPKKGSDAKKIARELNKKSAVWQAYVAPRPVPAAVASGSQAGSRNFEPSQGYLHSAPNGIGAIEAWALAGAKGNGVTICDIEGNWNRTHEDLPSGIPLLGGTLINDIGWRNHGTAVLGEMIGIPDVRGVAGISHLAKAKVHSAMINGVFNAAGAITTATANLKAGDVILIELQATGPNGKYVAMQVLERHLLRDRGGDGQGHHGGRGRGERQRELRSRHLQQHRPAEGQRGHCRWRGRPADQSLRHRLQLSEHRRAAFAIWFSNYGKILNVQAWGWHVTTLGYGDAQGGASENTWYTLRFSGTSSASPIVTGSVACLQGRAKSKNGGPLTPAKVRNILMASGTPQESGTRRAADAEDWSAAESAKGDGAGVRIGES